jgi:hypothetical protein
MRRWIRYWAAAVALLAVAAFTVNAADNPKVLIGSWSGRATGPQGGPPTGDITVTFERDPAGLKGTIVVKGAGTLQYSGQVSKITLHKGVFSGTAIFKLGENPLEVEVTGPLKGKKIEGTFSVMAKGQKMGDGTFAITKGTARKPAR